MELLEGDLTDYASIMYDASTLPLEENIRKTAAFVQKRGKDILIEGACDEIVDATGSVRNALTTPEHALRFCQETGVDLVVCNLGTEHRATGKDLQYHGEVSRAIRDAIGHPDRSSRHLLGAQRSGAPSCMTTACARSTYGRRWSGTLPPPCLRIWCATPGRWPTKATVDRLVADGLLTNKANPEEPVSIAYFTTLYRQNIIFEKMKAAVREYLDMWYPAD